MQERRNSIANALELRLSCTKPSKCSMWLQSDDFFGYCILVIPSAWLVSLWNSSTREKAAHLVIKHYILENVRMISCNTDTACSMFKDVKSGVRKTFFQDWRDEGFCYLGYGVKMFENRSLLTSDRLNLANTIHLGHYLVVVYIAGVAAAATETVVVAATTAAAVAIVTVIIW